MFVLELRAVIKELENVDFRTEQMNFLKMRRFALVEIEVVLLSVKLFVWWKTSEMLHGFGYELCSDARPCNL